MTQTPPPHFKTAAFYMTADSIVIRCRLNVSLGAHGLLLCIPGELTHHVCCTTLLKQQPFTAWNGAWDSIFVSFSPRSDTTCLMATTHKCVSHCSFIDTSQETESSHTAVKANDYRSSAVIRWQLGAAAAVHGWTKTHYDRQTKVQPVQTEMKWKRISANSAETQLVLLNHLRLK